MEEKKESKEASGGRFACTNRRPNEDEDEDDDEDDWGRGIKAGL
jgi:hypothetical protein